MIDVTAIYQIHAKTCLLLKEELFKPETMSFADAALRASRLSETTRAVLEMARRRAHGEEIEDYLLRAPLQVDPEQFIRDLLDNKVVFTHQCEPTASQLVGCDWLYGRRVGHPFHCRFYAPPSE